MGKNAFLTLLVLLFLVLNAVFLAVGIFQKDLMERRVIDQGKKLKQISEKVSDLGLAIKEVKKELGKGIRVTGPAQQVPGFKSLNPGVANFLKPDTFKLKADGADTNGIIHREFGSDPKGFNIIIENAADLAYKIERYVGISLAVRAKWTKPDDFVGEAAHRIEVTKDYQEYTVYLKKGIKWHKPAMLDLTDPKYQWMNKDRYLTAKDVAFTLKIIQNPQVQNGFAKSYFQDIKEWEIIDDHTIIIRWSKKTYNSISTTLGMSVIPEWFYGSNEHGEKFPEESLGLNFNKHWFNNKGLISAGPYIFSNYQPGESIKLVRNSDFFGESPAIKEIHYQIYTDPNQTRLRLKAHRLMVGSLRPSEYRDEILQWKDKPKNEQPDSPFLDGRIEHRKLISAGYSYIGWNGDKPIFKDKLVRRAMTFAFNREEIIKNVYLGLGKVAVGPYNSESNYHAPEIKPFPFDLQKAAALLKKLGWEDTDQDGVLDKKLNPNDEKRTPFEFRFLFYGPSPELKTMANIFKEDLLKIGVRMKMDPAEWSLMQKKMNEKKFDAFMAGWGLGWEPDPFQLWHSSQADLAQGSNRIGFRNKKADRIIEKLRETFGLTERIKLLRDFHRIIHDEQPYTFFKVGLGVACNWSELKNLQISITSPKMNSLPWHVESN